MKNKILTIVIPTYNMEALLGRCLDSLLINGSPNSALEVLVIIDGATDRSSEIAHGYETRFPEIFHVIDKPNGNYGSCINKGLAEAQGKYIKILDADDSVDSTGLMELITVLQRYDTDLILTDYSLCNTEGDVLSRKSFNIDSYTLHNRQALTPLGAHMAMHAVTYKTENLRRIEYHQTEGISYTDQEWIFRPMTTVNSFLYLNTNVYRYTVGRDGQTMDIDSMARNMHHNLTVLRNLTGTYSNVRKNDDIYGYLRNRIEGYAEYIYSLYLFNTDKMDLSPLITFDKELSSSCPTLYRYLGTLYAGKLPFVKLWRLFYYKKDHGINNFFRYRRYRPNLKK